MGGIVVQSCLMRGVLLGNDTKKLAEPTWLHGIWFKITFEERKEKETVQFVSSIVCAWTSFSSSSS